MTIQEAIEQVKNRVEFDAEKQELEAESYECDVWKADPEATSSHPAKHWLDGRYLQHAQDSKLITSLLEIIQEQYWALEQYADGTAYDFNRQIRGEINFDAGLSSAIARTAIQSTLSALQKLERVNEF